MSILAIAQKKRRLHRHFLLSLILCLVFSLVLANVFVGNALAASVGDVVTQVSKANLSSPDFEFGQEEATGYGFAIHAGMGDFGSGGCMLSVLGPAQPDEIKIMIDYVDSISQISYMQTTQLKGCEVREYATEYGVGIGVVLPDYFITVEMLETGQSQSANMASAKSIAQQTIDAMEKAGLLSQAAPDIETGTSETEEQPAGEPATAEPLEEPVRVSDTTNIMAVYNGPTVPTTFSINSPHLVTEIHNYHWNNAQGANPGTIGLQDQNGKVYGPWQAVGTPGQGEVPNANWFVYPNIVVPAGTYTIIDSDPSTWSQNGDSGGKGMGYVLATPHFETTGAAPGDGGNMPGSYPRGQSHSPAGVGSVGNIPGPSNTTEAVTGVVVPGLIATALGALGGLGGGGFTPPAGGTPMYPTGGGSMPGTGGTPGTGSGAPGMAKATSQFGRRGKEEILLNSPDMHHGSAIQGAPADQGIYIETEREAGLFVQPEPLISDPGPEIFIDTIDMHVQAIDIREPGGETGIFIDTTDMFEGTLGKGVEVDQGIFIETEEEAALFVKGNMDADMETAQMKPQAFNAREGEAGEAHFAVAGNDQGAPAVEQTEMLYTDTNDSEVLLDSSFLDDSETAEIGAGSEEVTTVGAEAPTGEEPVVTETEGVFDQNGFDAEGFDKDGFDAQGFNKEGFDKNGFNAEGFNKEGFDKAGFDQEGFDVQGFDKEGFDKNGFNAEGFNKEGFDKAGFDQEGFNREGFDREGFDREGFDKNGFDTQGFDKEGFDKSGFDAEGFNKEGFDVQGFDKKGFDKEGFDRNGFDAQGFDKEGFDKSGFDAEGFNKEGFDKAGFDQEGFNREGFDREGFDKNGFDAQGFDKEGFDKAGFDAEGFDKEGFNKAGFDKEGFNREGFDQAGFDKEGFNREGFDREGFNKAGFDTEGFDREGFNKEGFDREGYGRNGFDPEGFDRDGYDVNGFDRKGYNRSGFDAQGFDKQGYDKDGFNKDGWDREGYDRKGFDNNGWDREGFDKNGYDAEGYDRDGYNREGQSKEGYDTDGYDKNGFNEHGYDRDGYDREGFDFEGYNRGGYDPWGYNKQGYGKDGYHWSGYNADGYDRIGRHWSDNPYEEGSLFNVDTRNPFDGEIIDLGGRREAWEPTKPPLGEPYHGTVEKYGPKSWGEEIPAPQTEKPTIPSTTEDSGVIGPEDPMNTLKNHGIDKDTQAVPEERFPGDQIPETQSGNTFDYTDPETGVSSTYEYEPGYTGPRHGERQVLQGSGDGQTYEIEFDAVKGKWINSESGNEFDPDRFESWQRDVAEDKRRAAIDLEKMSRREDATSKAIDKNLEDWRKLEQMQKAAEKYNIGEPGGPGDVDKSIQNLKDDMLAGKQLDQEKMDKIRRVIDNRILGKTTADTGERWEEDWVKNLGWGLEANLATAKEVVTGEKDDGSTSWLGMGARLMIMGATGGLAGGTSLTYVTMDGAMNVAEAMYRIKDEIDKGGSDFRAVSKAVGTFILGEQMGWLAGEAGGKAMGEMMERFPAFTNKTADLLETAMLKVSAKNQMWSKALGMVSKDSAEESIDQINKRLVDIGSDKAAKEIIDSARADYGLKSVADSFDDVTKAGKTGIDTTGDIAGRAANSAGDGWSDVGESGGKAASSSDNITARGGKTSSVGDEITGSTGKAASGTTDDIAGGPGKAVMQSDADGVPGPGKAVVQTDADGVPGTGKADVQTDVDGVPGTGKADVQTDVDGVPGTGKAAMETDADGVPGTKQVGENIGDAPTRSATAGGDGPGEPPGGRPSGVGDDMPAEPDNLPLNRGGRTPDEVMADPAAVARAERTVQDNVQDFDNLSPARQQELVREQAIYDEYRLQAEERTWNLADKVQRGEPLTVEDIMEMKSDPASMRNLKNLREADGLGSQLTQQEAEGIQREFNNVMDEYIHQPSYRVVEDHLHNRYPEVDPEGIRVRTVRTPGTEPTDFNINTDNDVIAERLVHGPNGPEWVEIPKAEWEDTYYKALAENSGFSVDEAGRRFPQTDWANMDEASQVRQWARHHEEAAMDQFDLSAGRDFSNQRTWRLTDGDLPGRPMIEATPEEIARGVDTVMIDGKPMRPSTGYELTQRGQGTMMDPEQLSLMEQHKFDDYWNAGDTPAQVMRNQTEAMEQMRKTANVAQTVENSYRNMGYRVEAMPDNMRQAIAVINNNNLSPAARAVRLQELGYSSPGDFLEKVSSRIGAIRIAQS